MIPRRADAPPRNGHIPLKPSDLPTAASLMPREDKAPPDPPPARPGKLPVTTQGLYRGRLFTVTLDAALSTATLDRLCDRLDALGLEPLPLPVAYTPDGDPICPKHRTPMRRREKQGDTWHSHQVVDGSGQEVYCKGRPGADSPGWDCP